MRFAAVTLNATCYSLCTKHYWSPTFKLNDTKWKQNEREWITDLWNVCISMIQSLEKRAEHRVLYYGKMWHWEKSYLAHKSVFIQKQKKERLQILIIYTNATLLKKKNLFKVNSFSALRAPTTISPPLQIPEERLQHSRLQYVCRCLM